MSVVGIYRPDGYRVTNLAFVPLRAGERILVQGQTEAMQGLEKFSDFTRVDVLGADELSRHYAADERLFVVRLPKDSELVDVTLEKSRLADAFDLEHISVGDVFRWNVQHRTKLGAQVKRVMELGELVSDELVEVLIE